MADIKISELIADTAPVSADVFPLVDSTGTATTKKVTLANLVTSIASFVKTLTNTTFDTAGAGNTFKVNGTSITDKTGTGKVVLDTSPTIATPTLTAPIFSTVTNTGTLTLPTSTDTLVGRATTDTLTNKTLTTPTIADLTNANHTHQNTSGGGQLSATSIFSGGTVPTARLGSGTANSSSFLRGDQTWSTVNVTYGFGDGSDGTVNMDGTNTFSFASKSGNNYTLTRDIYATTLTLNGASVTLDTAGFLVFCSVAITGTGKILYTTGNAGGNASGGTAGTAGTAFTTRYLKNNAGTVGATGGTANVGVDATSATGSHTIGSVNVVGGAGGAGNSGFNAGGSGGSVSSLSYSTKFGMFATSILKMLDINTDGTWSPYTSSLGGNGGGSGGSFAASQAGGGGGGGASGGTVFVAALSWAGTFTIQAIGGAGGNGGNGTSNGAGGGGGSGGSGGVSVFVYGSKTWSGSYALTGGAGGTGGTAGGGTGSTNGSAGSTGTTGVSYELAIDSLIR